MSETTKNLRAIPIPPIAHADCSARAQVIRDAAATAIESVESQMAAGFADVRSRLDALEKQGTAPPASPPDRADNAGAASRQGAGVAASTASPAPPAFKVGDRVRTKFGNVGVVVSFRTDPASNPVIKVETPGPGYYTGETVSACKFCSEPLPAPDAPKPTEDDALAKEIRNIFIPAHETFSWDHTGEDARTQWRRVAAFVRSREEKLTAERDAERAAHAETRKALWAEKDDRVSEADRFNAGFDAANAGVPATQRPADDDDSSWEIGWYWRMGKQLVQERDAALARAEKAEKALKLVDQTLAEHVGEGVVTIPDLAVAYATAKRERETMRVCNSEQANVISGLRKELDAAKSARTKRVTVRKPTAEDSRCAWNALDATRTAEQGADALAKLGCRFLVEPKGRVKP